MVLPSSAILYLPLGSNVVYAFQQSDLFAKIIIVLLLLFSVQAWTIMIDKGMALRRARRVNRLFLRQFSESRGPLDLIASTTRLDGPMMGVYRGGTEEIGQLLDLGQNDMLRCANQGRLPRLLTPYEVDRVRSALERSVSVQVDALENRLGLLGTTVTVSPFLGLLGTVWGVMMAFAGMAQAGRPDIGAMAPGVSGALLTTVVGLVVAIPSVIGFNLLTGGTRQAITDLDNFVDDFVSLLRLQSSSSSNGSTNSPVVFEE